MRRLLSFSFSLTCVILLACTSTAQTTATSEPVGFTTTSCLSSSDTFVSLSFTRAAEFVGAISSAAGSTINVSGTTGWTSDQFVYNGTSQHNHYYALIGTGGGPKEGHFYNVTGNSTTALTVDTSTDDLSSIPVNAQVLVIPHWTLATIYPASDANISFTPTTSVPTYKTEILPNLAFAGSNLPTLPTYYFDGSTSKWRRVGDGGADFGDDVIAPDGYFVVRNANGAPTLPLTNVGSVLTKKFTTPLVTTTVAQPKDNAAAMIRPVDVALNATGLSPTDGSFVASTLSSSTRNDSRLALKDQLLLFDNTQVAMDKSPTAVYYYLDAVGKAAGWKLSGDGLTDHGNDVIPAGSAIVIRKARTLSAQTVFWTNAPTY